MLVERPGKKKRKENWYKLGEGQLTRRWWPEDEKNTRGASHATILKFQVDFGRGLGRVGCYAIWLVAEER